MSHTDQHPYDAARIGPIKSGPKELAAVGGL
jgi:hypothetical protein